MGKAFGLVMILVSLYIGMSIYTRGAEQTLDSVHQALAPIEPVAQRDTPLATGLSPAAGLADAPSGGENRPVAITDRVRNQVSADLSLGAERRGYGAESGSD